MRTNNQKLQIFFNACRCQHLQPLPDRDILDRIRLRPTSLNIKEIRMAQNAKESFSNIQGQLELIQSAEMMCVQALLLLLSAASVRLENILQKQVCVF